MINRGNARATVFHKDEDYLTFINLLIEAKLKFLVKALAFCLRPNHFHLVVQPFTNPSLSSFMQWLLTSHVRRHHRIYRIVAMFSKDDLRAFPSSKMSTHQRAQSPPVKAGLASEYKNMFYSSRVE